MFVIAVREIYSLFFLLKEDKVIVCLIQYASVKKCRILYAFTECEKTTSTE